jgi:hypothetical protein
MPVPNAVENRALDQVAALLEFGAQSGKDIPEAVALTIAQSWEARSNSVWTPQVSAAFWSAYNRVCVALKPVSLDTLSANQMNVPRWWLPFWRRAGDTSMSKRAAGNYLSIMVVSLLVSIGLQFVVSTSTTLQKEIDDILAANEKVVEKISSQLTTLAVTVADKAADDFSTLSLSAEQKTLVDAVKAEFQQIWFGLDRTSTKLKLLTYLTTAGMVPVDFTQGSLTPRNNLNDFNADVLSYYESRRYIISVQETAGFSTKIINFTLLPLLLGIVGSSAYVTRLISDQIKDTTFSSTSPVRHQVRVALGALAGVIVGFGWVGGAASLSPLALAFGAGYAIEPGFCYDRQHCREIQEVADSIPAASAQRGLFDKDSGLPRAACQTVSFSPAGQIRPVFPCFLRKSRYIPRHLTRKHGSKGRPVAAGPRRLVCSHASGGTNRRTRLWRYPIFLCVSC